MKTKCKYTGYDFGACYPDSMCIDGYLWDLDYCDKNGNLIHGGEEVGLPCPACNTWKYIERNGNFENEFFYDNMRFIFNIIYFLYKAYHFIKLKWKHRDA